MEYVPVAKTGYPGYHLPGLAAPPGFLARVEDLRSHQQPSPQLGEQIWAEVHSSFLEEVLWPQIFHGFIMFKQKIQLAIPHFPTTHWNVCVFGQFPMILKNQKQDRWAILGISFLQIETIM